MWFLSRISAVIPCLIYKKNPNLFLVWLILWRAWQPFSSYCVILPIYNEEQPMILLWTPPTSETKPMPLDKWTHSTQLVEGKNWMEF